MNVLAVTGRLVSDPARRETSTNGVICEFRLAVDCKPRIWLPVTCWGRLAGVCAQHLHRGRRVAVCGALRVDQWNAKNGDRQERWFLAAREVTFLDDPGGPAPASDRPHDSASCTSELVAPQSEA